MKLSFWETETYYKGIDVLIVGSGIVGLSAALELKQKSPKLKILIVERGTLPSGASTKNAGFACFGSCSELLDDLNHTAESEVAKLVERRFRGLLKLRKSLGDKAIDFKPWGGYELFDKKEDFSKCQENLSYLNKLLGEITGNKSTYTLADTKIETFGFKSIQHLIFNSEEGQIDTGMMMKALILKAQKAGVLLLNGVKCTAVNAGSCSVSLEDGDEIFAGKILVTTNGFAQELLPELNVNPARAQVLITKPIAGLKLKGCFHYDKGYYYFRNVGERVLFGGGRNLDFKGEETTTMAITRTIQNQLERMLRDKIIPNHKFEIEQRWSGIMGVGEAKIPIVKQVHTNVFCAVRMGGMGVALGSMVAEEVAQLILQS